MKLLRSRRACVLLLLGLLLGTGLGIPLYHYHYKWKWAVKRYQRELRAAGEELDIDKLIPPAVLPEQNGASYFRNASAMLARGSELLNNSSPAAMPMIAPGKAIVVAAEPEIHGDKGTNTWEEVEKELEQYQAPLQSLEQLLTHRVLDFGLDYHQGFSMLLPHLANLKNAVQRLTAAAMCDLHRGDTEAATLKIRVSLALAHGLEREPLIISQLVRIAVAAIVVSQTWALLQANDLTDAQLAALQSDWQKVNSLQSAEAAVAMERAMSESTIEKMRLDEDEFRAVVNQWGGGGSSTTTTPPSFVQMAETAFRESGQRSKALWWRFAWSYPDEWRMLQGTQIGLETFRRVRSGAPFCKTLKDQQTRLLALAVPASEDSGRFGGNVDVRSLFSQGLWSSAGLAKRVQSIEISRQVVLAAIALKRYYLRHHNYPPDLAALVPEFLPATPRDLIDGASLRYQRQENSFLLYSIGEDGKDDRGDPRPDKEESSSRPGGFYWLRGRDWVWPQPASAEEVAEFYNRKRDGTPGDSLRQRYGRPPASR
jgi:hypothetical protein